MEFNPDKCEIIRITNRKKKVVSCYSIHGKALKEVTCVKYLGVTIDRKLTWNDRIDNITKKANNTRVFLQRNISSCPQAIKIAVLPDLCKTYCGVCVDCMGHPSTKKYTKAVENIQRQAAHFVMNDYQRCSSVGNMLESLKWKTLHRRRADAKLMMLYRINHKLVDVTTKSLAAAPTRTRGSAYRFYQTFTRVDAYKFSFFPSALRLWNKSTQELVSQPSVERFRQCLLTMPT